MDITREKPQTNIQIYYSTISGLAKHETRELKIIRLKN